MAKVRHRSEIDQRDFAGQERALRAAMRRRPQDPELDVITSAFFAAVYYSAKTLIESLGDHEGVQIFAQISEQAVEAAREAAELERLLAEPEA